MRELRRLAYPLRLAALRLARRAPTAGLAMLGVAAGAAMLAAVLAGTLLARDRSVGQAVSEIPDAQRSARAVWGGLLGQAEEEYGALDLRARRALGRALGREPAGLALFRESTIAGRFLGLGAVDGLSRWVELRSGRLPRACRPERCEVVRVRGEGRIPSVPGLRLVEVGEASLVSGVLFGDFLAPEESALGRAALSPAAAEAASYHRPPPAPLVLAEGVEGLVGSPELGSVYRSYAWLVPLEASTVRAWDVDRFGGRVARARSSLQAASSSFEVTAPVEELRAAAEASETAGRRLLLVGGQAAALVFAFAVLAAVGMRRDVAAARRRLTWYGARRWQIGAVAAAETTAVAVLGVAAGWGLGALAFIAVAGRADTPAGELLAHSTLSADGLALAAATAGVVALVLSAALHMRPLDVRGRSLSPLDLAALGAVAVTAVALARGDLDREALAGEEGSAAILVLLPGLVTLAAAVLCARLFGPALVLLERATRRRALPLRLAALSLARRPGHAAVALSFLVVSVGLALFAESYRSTLARGQAEQAAYAVPLDFTVREDLSRLVPVLQAAPPEHLATLQRDARVEPVLRLSASVARPGGATGVTVLGLDTSLLRELEGWRSDFAGPPPEELSRRIDPDGEASLQGPRIPEDATALVLPARGRGVALTASVETRAGRFTPLELGEARRDGEALLAPIPADARGGRVVALTLVPPRIQERGADAGRPFEGTLVLGPLAARRPSGQTTVTGFEGWIGTDGVAPTPGAVGVSLDYTLTEQLASRFRPAQPADGRAVAAIASPGIAAAAGEGGRLPLRVGGEQVVLRVAAVARRFPGTRGDFLVADRELLRTALNTARPGLAVVNEVWIAARSRAGEQEIAAALDRPPFDVLAVESRRALEDDLRRDPLARGALVTLLAGALVALALALAGLVLGVLADVRDDRGELFDLEAQGVRPSALRRLVATRWAIVAAAGLLGGLLTALVLASLVVDLVAVTAGAGVPEPPLRLTVDWPVVALAAGVCALLAAVLVGGVARAAFRASDAPSHTSEMGA